MGWPVQSLTQVQTGSFSCLKAWRVQLESTSGPFQFFPVISTAILLHFFVSVILITMGAKLPPTSRPSPYSLCPDPNYHQQPHHPFRLRYGDADFPTRGSPGTDETHASTPMARVATLELNDVTIA